MANVEENIFLARVAEQAERFDDMVNYLVQVLEAKGAEVTSDERNLLSVAFKNLISSQRAACRTIGAIEQNPKYSKHSEALAKYKSTIEAELCSNCERVISAINDKVITKGCSGEPQAFFLKMIGDYYRYIAENATESKLDNAKNNALKFYDDANNIELAPCNPIKLGLALNFSVFHYEVMKNHGKACELADSAL